MRTGPAVLCGAVALALGADVRGQSDGAANAWTATQLVSLVAARRATTGFAMRGSLQFAPAGGDRVETRQILVRGRNAEGAHQVLYVCLWPRTMKGHAVRMDREADGRATFYRFEPPDRFEPLPPERAGEPLFGTGLTCADLSEPFWRWDAVLRGGTSNVLGHACLPVEFRDHRSPGSPPDVRTWVAPSVGLPLLVETLDRQGTVVRLWSVESLVRRGKDRWYPARATVTDRVAGSRTTLIVRGGERDVAVPASDFTPEGIRKLANPVEAEPFDP